MRAHNVLIMTWGVDRHGNFIPKQNIDLPKKCFVTINFDRDIPPIGIASNFRITDKGVICDITFDRDVTSTIAPSLQIKKRTIEDTECRHFISVISCGKDPNKVPEEDCATCGDASPWDIQEYERQLQYLRYVIYNAFFTDEELHEIILEGWDYGRTVA